MVGLFFFQKEAIEDWKFNFESIKEFDKSELLLTKDSIDGCITFYDMKVKKLKFLTKNAFCEDSINLIRSKGSIDEILIYNPLKDGIDLDFSNIKIKNIYVVNSGDDCIDLSYGDYKIEKSKLYNCFDNGISIGEKSNLISETLSIKDSKVGVAVKDSSKVSIDLLNSINNQFCFKIYNKKQEFLGGELRLKNMNCSNNLYKVETGSKFTLINDF